MTIVHFGKYDCRLRLGRYANNRLAIRLEAADTKRNFDNDLLVGDAIATATVNLPSQQLGADEAFIKDWEENEGILEALVASGAVTTTGRFSSCELKAPIVRVNPKKFIVLQ